MPYVVVGPHCWGQGSTLKQAISRCRCAFPVRRADKYEMPFNAYLASDDFTIDARGTIEATELTKLREVRYDDAGQRSERNAPPWHDT